MPDSALVKLPTRLVSRVTVQTPASGKTRGESLTNDKSRYDTMSIRDIRVGTDQTAVMRQLYEEDGTISTAVLASVQTALSGYIVTAYALPGLDASTQGQLMAEELLSRWDTVWDYTAGYADRNSVEQTLAQQLLEAALTGGIGLEMVLDKYKMPDKLVLFPYDTITWKSDGKTGRFPSQRRQGGARGGQSPDVDLNLPNVWVAETVKEASKVYSMSHMVSAFKRLYGYEEFIEDMQRVVRRGGQPRLVIRLDYDKVVGSAPEETRRDPEQLKAYMNSVKNDVETAVAGMNPEDALVTYDLAEVDSVSSKGEKSDYKELLEALAGLTASAVKANPSVLGLRMSSGSQNTTSTESMLFTKMAALLQLPVEVLMSRALTLGVRLQGFNGFVKFKFKPIELRPDSELEAHKQIKQNRVLELLSLGRVTDSEAQVGLGLDSLPSDAPELSGTFFYDTKAPDTVPVSGTNARNQDLQPDGPSSAGGKDNEERP